MVDTPNADILYNNLEMAEKAGLLEVTVSVEFLRKALDEIETYQFSEGMRNPYGIG